MPPNQALDPRFETLGFDFDQTNRAAFFLRSQSCLRGVIMDHACADDFCDSCRAVVTRAYRELRGLGEDDASAFKSAVTVLALRHPGRARSHYTATVADWLSDDA